MDVFKTYLFFAGYDEGHPYLIDTISLGGQWWLVGSWLEPHAAGEKIPERLVRLTGLRFQEVEGRPYRFLLNNTLPKRLLEGEEVDGYVTAPYLTILSAKGPTGLH